MNEPGCVVDTIVRFHDPRRLVELQRCVLSLAAQTYQPVHVHIVTQRFCTADTLAVHRSLEPLFDLHSGPKLSIHNWSHSGPSDARSHLLNYGLRFAAGRFLGFLDYDDVLYPEAYDLLTKQLCQSNTGIAFASVRVMRVEVFDTFCYVTRKERKENIPFFGNTLLDLFCGNFAPIHSYLIDRTRIDGDLLQFDCDLSWEEDYEFLLRVCSRHRADFSLLDTQIGDYYYKEDGGNTVPKYFGMVNEAIKDARARIVLSKEVVEALGLPQSARQITVQEVVHRYARRHHSIVGGVCRKLETLSTDKTR